MNSDHWKGEPSKKQENCNMEESKTIARMENENRHEKEFQVQETEEDKVVMMCWENMDGSLAEEPNEETDSQNGRADDETEKPKYEEEHADCTLDMGNQLKS